MTKKAVLIASVLSLIVACGDGEDRQQKYLERAQQFLADTLLGHNLPFGHEPGVHDVTAKFTKLASEAFVVIPNVQFLQDGSGSEICMLLQLLAGKEVCLSLDDSLLVRREDPESDGLSGSHGCIVNEAFSYAGIYTNFYIRITKLIY